MACAFPKGNCIVFQPSIFRFFRCELAVDVSGRVATYQSHGSYRNGVIHSSARPQSLTIEAVGHPRPARSQPFVETNGTRFGISNKNKSPQKCGSTKIYAYICYTIYTCIVCRCSILFVFQTNMQNCCHGKIFTPKRH